MTRRISKRGNSYAAGSHSTRGDYPDSCETCGERVYVSSRTDTRPLWFETIAGIKRSYHHACWLGRSPPPDSG